MAFEPKELPDDEHDTCRIKSVYHWPNGMAMVFCEHGQQMPYYQGPSAVMRERIAAKMNEQRSGEETWFTAQEYVMPPRQPEELATRR